jgi:hypothetical protein
MLREVGGVGEYFNAIGAAQALQRWASPTPELMCKEVSSAKRNPSQNVNGLQKQDPPSQPAAFCLACVGGCWVLTRCLRRKCMSLRPAMAAKSRSVTRKTDEWPALA